jgi:peptidoglycan-N-acetylglucosamine deacetylase
LIRKIIIGFVLFILLCYGIWELHKSRNYQVFGQIISRVDTLELVMALTFDDGPSAMYTDTVLAILRDRDVKATFFVTGSETERYLASAIKIVEEGHELGNHSYSHQRMVLKSPGTIRDEIERADHAIRNTGYQGPVHFRPPYGKKLFSLPWYLSKHDRTTVMWDLEPESYPEIASSADEIVRYVIENVQPGSILLLQVMYAGGEESRKALPIIIDRLREMGYHFKTVSELLDLNDA